MERTAKLYKLYAELTVVKKGIDELAAVRPNPYRREKTRVKRHRG